jgi:hypothetical protein
MSLAKNLDQFEDQRKTEFAKLRAAMHALGSSLEYKLSPSRWVHDHPYATTLTAAALGFVIAQFPGKSPPAKSPPAPAGPKKPRSELLPMLMNLAQQFLSPAAPTEEKDPTLAVENIGTLSTPTFPRTF